MQRYPLHQPYNYCSSFLLKAPSLSPFPMLSQLRSSTSPPPPAHPPPYLPISFSNPTISPTKSSLIKPTPLLLLPLIERIGNLLAPVERTDQHEEGAAGDDEAEGSGGGVAFVVWRRRRRRREWLVLRRIEREREILRVREQGWEGTYLAALPSHHRERGS